MARGVIVSKDAAGASDDDATALGAAALTDSDVSEKARAQRDDDVRRAVAEKALSIVEAEARG